jgi:isoquinoline 1-oxidoreductase beta subunit
MSRDPRTELVITNISRRSFLIGLGAGSLVLAAGFPVLGRAEEEQKKYAGEAMPHGLRDDPMIFVAIAADGIVSIVCHRSEMGQGVRTSLPMVVADELEADWSRVRVTQAPGNEPIFGNQDTDGSRSMRHHFMSMRRIGAAARRMLEEAAAAEWNVPVAEVEAVNHEVIHRGSDRRLGYGELADAAAALAVPARESVKLKNPSKFRYIGRGEVGLVDNLDITTGKAQFGIDTRLDGMVYAVVARPPVYGGKLKSYDDAETLKVPGVLKVLTLEAAPVPSEFNPLGGVAVIASNTWAAIRGRDALKITWDDGPNASYSSDTYRATLEAAARQPGKLVRSAGDVDAAMATAVQRVEAEYYIPHQAHVTMEPPAATARIVDGKCEVWACVQAPQTTREKIAKHLGLEVQNVTVNVTLLGGGFGRKSKPDFAIEAALLSRAMDGRPLKLTFTREDDLANGYLNTVAVQRLEAGLDANGMPVAWLHRSAAPTITALFGPDSKQQAPFELGMGFVDTPFAVPNLRLENPEATAHTRVGWFRSVFNVPHAFAIQSFVGELAAAAGRDPKDYLLELIGPPRQIDPNSLPDSWNYGEDPAIYQVDAGRLRRVVETAAEGAGWGKTLPKGRGLGIAAHRSFVTYTAAVVEVQVSDAGELTIPRVDIAVDCGPQINPERIRSQMEGAVIQGVSLATVSAATFKDGRVEQRNFDSYQITRIDTAPREIHVHLVPAESYDQPLGGVGEPGLPPVAPALCNAVFAATGKRIRALPIGDQLRA